MAKPGEQTRWSRRKLMGALGAGVGLGVASQWEPGGGTAAGAPAQAGGLSIPRGAIIRTITADVDPGAITGATLMHEHLGNGRRPPARGAAPGTPPGPPDNPTQDVDWMTTELKGARQAGVGCIVSASAGGSGAEIPAYLKTLSERTGGLGQCDLHAPTPFPPRDLRWLRPQDRGGKSSPQGERSRVCTRREFNMTHP